MFNKLRRKSKELASSITTAVPPPPSPPNTNHQPSRSKTITFFHLPPELRIAIYELAASETRLLLFSNSSASKAPSLLFVSRQVRTEYRPILLSLAPLKAHIKDYDFRPLIRVVGSLYSTDLKALRTNKSLTVMLHLEESLVTSKDSIALLRRWAVKRAEHLDRLQWSYELAKRPSEKTTCTMAVAMERLYRLRQSTSAVRKLQTEVHESLAAEIQPIYSLLDTYCEARSGVLRRALPTSGAPGPRHIWVGSD